MSAINRARKAQKQHSNRNPAGKDEAASHSSKQAPKEKNKPSWDKGERLVPAIRVATAPAAEHVVGGRGGDHDAIAVYAMKSSDNHRDHTLGNRKGSSREGRGVRLFLSAAGSHQSNSEKKINLTLPPKEIQQHRT